MSTATKTGVFSMANALSRRLFGSCFASKANYYCMLKSSDPQDEKRRSENSVAEKGRNLVEEAKESVEDRWERAKEITNNVKDAIVGPYNNPNEDMNHNDAPTKINIQDLRKKAGGYDLKDRFRICLDSQGKAMRTQGKVISSSLE